MPDISGVQNPAQPRRVGVPAGGVNPGFVDARPGVRVAMANQAPAAPAPAAPAEAVKVPARPAPVTSAVPVANVPSIGVPAAAPERRQVGFFEKGGVRTPIYHDQVASPEGQAQPTPVAPQARNDAADRANRQISNLIRKQSSLYDYDRMHPEDFAAAMGALGGHLQSLDQGGAHVQAAQAAAQAQYGADPHRDPAYRAALVQKLGAETAQHQAQAAHFTAEANANKPGASLDLLREINKDPALCGLYLAGKGVSPAEIAALPAAPTPGKPGEPAINPGNLQQHLAMQHNAGMADLLKQDVPLLERVRRASQFPGFADLNHPNRQLFDSYLKQQYTDPKKWLNETYVPENPDNQWPVVGRVTGVLGAINGAMPWSDQNTGTGFGWRQNYEDATSLQDLLARYKISPFG